jgi:UDP-GlcNAc:undecaprenyl-phosphate/decaprenyl-phosphate GlcNAc-1-phosphate transferase
MSFQESLRALVVDSPAVLGFAVAAVIVVALTPVVARLAPSIGGVDDRDDRPRVHERPVPRIGGLAIVAAIAVPAAIWVDLGGPYLGILIGTLLAAAIGLVDDIRGVRPSVKMGAIVLVSLIPVVGYDVTFGHVTLPLFGDHDLGWTAYPLTIFWIAAVANLVNLIDGMDGLAAGIVAIAAFSYALLGASFGRENAAVLAAIVCGGTLAFLAFNYHPAKIFMGDTGALALGFLLAAVAVQGVMKTAATIALVGPLLVLAVPILDTSFVVLKRLKYRRPPWSADQNHFYHRFLRIGLSQRRTAAYLHVWAALLSAYAILLRFAPPRPKGVWDLENSLVAIGAGLVVLAASAWMVYTLEIVKQRHLAALRLRKPVPEEETQEAVERALTAGRH